MAEPLTHHQLIRRRASHTITPVELAQLRQLDLESQRRHRQKIRENQNGTEPN